MPKVKLGREDSANIEIRATIRKYMVLRDVNYKSLCDRLGMARSTLWRKLNSSGGIGTFSVVELRRIVNTLQIPADEIARPIIGFKN